MVIAVRDRRMKFINAVDWGGGLPDANSYKVLLFGGKGSM